MNVANAKHDPEKSGTERPRHFCRIGGIASSTALKMTGDVRSLLRVRLRAACLLLFFGFAAFLVLGQLLDPPTDWHEKVLRIGLAAVTVINGILAALVWTRMSLSVLQLRMIELSAFGSAAIFFVWSQFLDGCFCAGDSDPDAIRSFVAETVIPWIILIPIYGLFIPNTWKRAAMVISFFGACPILAASLVQIRHPDIHPMLFEQGIYFMALYILIPSIAAVYGSHRIRILSRAAVAARQLGAYTLRQRLGAGGMGEVYLAEHHLLKRPSAIKLIKPSQSTDPNALARFESEVRSTAQLTHPNTVEIYDYGHTEDGTFYYVMEFLPGLNLQELVERYGPLPPERVVHLLRQVCSALGEAHERGLVHRDIKPGNIFAAQRGGIYDFAKLLDFGLVKNTVPSSEMMKLTMEGTVLGSPLYAAPEIVMGDGNPDPRSDIYSLGATAYFLLTGRPVFQGQQPLRVMFAHANEAPSLLSKHAPNIPADLEAVVMRCLEKDPGARYQSVAALDRALAACKSVGTWTAEQARQWWAGAEEPTGSDSHATSVDEMAVTRIVAAET